MNRKAILLVDDEELALKYFTRAFQDRFVIHSAGSAQEALKVLEERHREIGVIVTDQRMPEATGVELLKVVRHRYPSTVRILTTGYSDLDTLVEAINTGCVYSFVSKPWELSDLAETLERALAHHHEQLATAEVMELKIEELKARILEDRVYDVGVISAKVGHYVHNSLCPITLLIDRLIDRAGAEKDLSIEFLTSMREHIYTVANTLKDLAQVSAPPSFRVFEEVSVGAKLDEALAATRVLREQHNLQVQVEAPADLPAVRGVPELIERLFRFMISEEVVSLPHGSRVIIRVQPQRVDGEVAGLLIEFEDFEPIPEGLNPESLLYPFNLRGSNPREFGVFLVSSYFIARHHGGLLHARMKKDRGLLFSFTLPRDHREGAWEPLSIPKHLFDGLRRRRR